MPVSVSEPAAVEFRPTPADDPLVLTLLDEYYAELDRRFSNGFDADLTSQADIAGTTPPNGVFVVVWLDGDPVGIGALRSEAPGVGEIKRMYLRDAARGHGLGRRLVRELEARAREFGMERVCLDSNEALTNAIAMYRELGYTDIERYNHHPYAHVWLGRSLTGE